MFLVRVSQHIRRPRRDQVDPYRVGCTSACSSVFPCWTKVGDDDDEGEIVFPDKDVSSIRHAARPPLSSSRTTRSPLERRSTRRFHPWISTFVDNNIRKMCQTVRRVCGGSKMAVAVHASSTRNTLKESPNSRSYRRGFGDRVVFQDARGSRLILVDAEAFDRWRPVVASRQRKGMLFLRALNRLAWHNLYTADCGRLFFFNDFVSTLAIMHERV